MENFISGLNLVIALVGVVTAVSGVTLVAYRWGWRIVRRSREHRDSHNKLSRLLDHFDTDDFGSLVAFVREAQAAIGELQVRQSIVEVQANVGIYIADRAGLCTWTNDWINAKFGLDSRRMVGWGWLEAVAQDQQDHVRNRWSTCVREGLPYSESYDVEPVDGSPRWRACTRAKPVIIDGEVINYVGFVKEEKNVQGE